MKCNIIGDTKQADKWRKIIKKHKIKEAIVDYDFVIIASSTIHHEQDIDSIKQYFPLMPILCEKPLSEKYKKYYFVHMVDQYKFSKLLKKVECRDDTVLEISSRMCPISDWQTHIDTIQKTLQKPLQKIQITLSQEYAKSNIKIFNRKILVYDNEDDKNLLDLVLLDFVAKINEANSWEELGNAWKKLGITK